MFHLFWGTLIQGAYRKLILEYVDAGTSPLYVNVGQITDVVKQWVMGPSGCQ